MFLVENGTYETVLAISISVPLLVGSLLAFSGTFKVLRVPIWRPLHEGQPEPRGEGPTAILDSDSDAAWPIPTGPERIQARFGLTDRETEVALMLARGRSIAYVGEALDISQNTVRNHARNIYTKLGIHTKQELIDIVVGPEK